MLTFYRRLWPILSEGTRQRLVVAAGAMIVISLLEGVGLVLLLPLLQLLTSADFSAQTGLIDAMASLFGAEGADLARLLALTAFAIYASKGFVAVVVIRWNADFAMREEARLARLLMRSYLGSPLAVHHGANTADFQRTVNNSLRQMFAGAFVGAFSAAADVVSLAVIIAVLVVSDPGIAFVGALYFGGVAVFYQRRVQRRLADAGTQVHSDGAAALRLVQQALSGVKEIKAAAVEESFVDRVYDARSRMVEAYRVVSLSGIQPRYILELAMVGAAAVVATFAFATRSPAAATAAISTFLAGGFRMLAPLNKVFQGQNQAKVALPAVDQITHDLLVLGPKAEDQLQESTTAVDLRPSVIMERVHFRYDTGPEVLSGINLEVIEGESVAIVGGSGAGKSTLVDLVLGLLDPTEGTISVDDHPMADVRRSWQRVVGYVPQSISLLDDTLRANIEFGRFDDDEDRLWEVLEVAQLDEFVRAMPLGLDTMIGEQGVRLSGGQRQRLGIARALYPRPRLLVLDEATSALDNRTEAELTAVLDRLRSAMTSLTVAHRLSTVVRADFIYYVEHGAVVDCGTFDELRERVPSFRRLVELGSMSADDPEPLPV